jgi:hypothetical protein
MFLTLLLPVGMCEGQLGNVPCSLLAHSLALKGDPKFREARLNLGTYCKLYYYVPAILLCVTGITICSLSYVFKFREARLNLGTYRGYRGFRRVFMGVIGEGV